MKVFMTIIGDHDLESYFDRACPFNDPANKPSHPPALAACLKALENQGVKEALKWEQKGDIRRLANLVEKGTLHSLPQTQKQAQAVAAMVTRLHLFKELPLTDRGIFLTAAPLSLRTLLLRGYDLARRFFNLFRKGGEGGRTAMVAAAVDTLKAAMKTPNEVPGRFKALYEEKLQTMGKKEKSVYLAVMGSLFKDVQQMDFEGQAFPAEEIS